MVTSVGCSTEGKTSPEYKIGCFHRKTHKPTKSFKTWERNSSNKISTAILEEETDHAFYQCCPMTIMNICLTKQIFLTLYHCCPMTIMNICINKTNILRWMNYIRILICRREFFQQSLYFQLGILRKKQDIKLPFSKLRGQAYVIQIKQVVTVN